MGNITKKHLPRRTFLRGIMGATVALPLLDSMIPAQTPLAQTAANVKLRLGFTYIPHGAVMSKWTPVGEGAAFDLSPTLTPLAPFRNQLLVVSGLASTAAEPQGDGGGDHSRSAPAFLSGTHIKKTDDQDMRAGITIDQIAARQLGQDTPLPSVELGIEDTGLAGTCDAGYSCAYMNTIAWRTATTPLPMEINPRVVFERLFGDGSSADERRSRLAADGSILDSLTHEVAHLGTGLGPQDRAKISEYLDNIREIERRIQKAEKHASSDAAVPQAPVGVPEGFEEHAKLMYDLQVLAYQAEVTRVTTFMLARDLSMRTYPQIGVTDPFHPTSHHGNNADKLEKLQKINQYNLSLFAYFLGKLASTPDGDGTLLDHSLLLYGSTMSNSNMHDHSPLPILVAGGACGQLKGGRHLKFPERTPLSNLMVSLLDKAGVRVETVGDSTGKLEI
jgi:hypothetical protein